jgi:putative toxin-antitoxin system antitoxin component (TIGR02293 family)
MTTATAPSPAAHRAALDFQRRVQQRRRTAADYVMLLGMKVQAAPALVERIGRGLEFSVFEALREGLDLTAAELVERLGIPERTFARRKKVGRFAADESDRLLRLARVFAAAIELFEGDLEKARAWLAQSKRGLGGVAPLEFAATEVGALEVENLIGRLEHGVYS